MTANVKDFSGTEALPNSLQRHKETLLTSDFSGTEALLNILQRHKETLLTSDFDGTVTSKEVLSGTANVKDSSTAQTDFANVKKIVQRVVQRHFQTFISGIERLCQRQRLFNGIERFCERQRLQ